MTGESMALAHRDAEGRIYSVGQLRSMYAATVEPRPRMFPETSVYIEWCARADAWADENYPRPTPSSEGPS